MQWVSPPISQRALLLLLCSYVFLAETVTLAAPAWPLYITDATLILLDMDTLL